MQRFTLTIKSTEFHNKIRMDGVCIFSFLLLLFVFWYSGVRGGGKCPEEEHTPCSGGPTIILSQARFTGIENIFIKYKNIL